MKIKYSPCKWNPNSAHNFPAGTKPDTQIKVLNDDSIEIDGKSFEFDPASVEWPDIHTQTNSLISEAHREDGELFLTIRRFYTYSCSGWDTGTFWDMSLEARQKISASKRGKKRDPEAIKRAWVTRKLKKKDYHDVQPEVTP